MAVPKLIRQSASRSVAVMLTGVVLIAVAGCGGGPTSGAPMPATPDASQHGPDASQGGSDESDAPQRGSNGPATPAPTPTETPGLSRTEPPTLPRPGTPPKTPSDLITGDWLVGTVTRGGTGPCYGLVTDDGTEHALYGDDGTTLTQHTRIRAKVAPLRIRIYCGPGQHWQLIRAEVIR
ncbi:hypothetical protein [Solwaraspora sp. WMMD792]|uniref:hypothetical protein n=1 Tax=Solwaraspora sp. WMMD792 TaxID=3016099 RepID=UPI002416F87B|nr:hypothetical protein [Solwaraspora sp. WMMD792]MDG4774430.1 hypothetical protein [Solwaraspora sp. WMMD792]